MGEQQAAGLTINVDAILSRAQASIDAFCKQVESRTVKLNIDAAPQQRTTFGGIPAPEATEGGFQQPPPIIPQRVDPQQIMQQRWVAGGVYSLQGGDSLSHLGMIPTRPVPTASVNSVYGRIEESMMRVDAAKRGMSVPVDARVTELQEMLNARMDRFKRRLIDDPMYRSLSQSIVDNSQAMARADRSSEDRYADEHKNLLAALQAREAVLESRFNSPKSPAARVAASVSSSSGGTVAVGAGLASVFRNTPLMGMARNLSPIGIAYAAVQSTVGMSLAAQSHEVAMTSAGSDYSARLEADLDYFRERNAAIPVVGSMGYNINQAITGNDRYARIQAQNIRSDERLFWERTQRRWDMTGRAVSYQAMFNQGLPGPLQQLLTADDRIKRGMAGIENNQQFLPQISQLQDSIQNASVTVNSEFKRVKPNNSEYPELLALTQTAGGLRDYLNKNPKFNTNGYYDEFIAAFDRRTGLQSQLSTLNTQRDTALQMATSTDEMTRFRGEYGIELYNKQIDYAWRTQIFENTRDIFGGLAESKRQEIEQRITPLKRELEKAQQEGRTNDAARYQTQLETERNAISAKYNSLEAGMRNQYEFQTFDTQRMTVSMYQSARGESLQGQLSTIDADRRRALKESFGERYISRDDKFTEEISDNDEIIRRQAIENHANVNRVLAFRDRIGYLTSANYQRGSNELLAGNQTFSAQFAGLYGQFESQLAGLDQNSSDYNVILAQQTAALKALQRGQTNTLANITLDQNVRGNVFAAQQRAVTGNFSMFEPQIESILGGVASRFQNLSQQGLTKQAQAELELGRAQLRGFAAEYGSSFTPTTYGRLGEIGGSGEIERNFAAIEAGMGRTMDAGVSGTSVGSDQIASIGDQINQFQKQGEGAPTQGDQQITNAIASLKTQMSELIEKVISSLPGNGNN